MTGSDSLVSRSARTRSLLLIAALLAALSVLSLFVAKAEAIVVSPTNFPLPGSSFQGGDGNQTNPTAPMDANNPAPFPANIDWQQLALSPSLVSVGDPNAQDSTFDTGSHENDPEHWDISTDPGGVTPAKANFFNAWNYVDETSQDTFLYLAFDRQESGGNVFLAFELNQDTRSWINASCDAIQCRKEGDLIVSYEIQNDDKIDVVIQTWDSTSEVTAADVAGGYTNGLGCSKTGAFIDFQPTGTVVQGAINAGTTIQNFLPRSPAAATLGEELFGEAAINLTDLFEDVIGNPCFSFGQISLHGRSSESDSASLQDLVGPVPLLVRNCTIGGSKYHDVDGDGATPPDGEPKLAGWKLYLDLNNNNQLDAGEPTTLTDANGNYVFTNLSDATYTIREAPDSEQAAGLKGFFCSYPSFNPNDCEHTATISAADRNITGKDFANYKKATVIVEKQTVPDGAAGSFPFTSTIPGKASFSLTDGQTSSTSVDPGVYTASENTPAGWTLTDITCSGDTIAPNSSDAGGTATFDAQSGETITCVFMNTKHASLTVVKATDPASDPQDFDFDLTGLGVPADLDLDTDPASAGTPSQQSFSLNAAQLGAHTVAESAVDGWSLTGLVCTGGGEDSSTSLGTRTATLDIDAGEDVVCTFTNTQGASLTVVKVTDPASDPQDFDFDLTGAAVPADLDLDTDGGDATLPSQQSFSLNASQLGAHSVTESVTPGWALTALECTGGGGDSSTSLGTRTATLEIDAGESVVCTFTNTKGASLTVVKVTDPASDPQDFDFDLTGAAVPADVDLDTDPGSAGTPSQDTFPVAPGQLGAYAVTESVTPGWDLTALECTGGGGDSSTDLGDRKATLDIDAGETVVSTFTNTKHASLTVVKVTDPASDPQDFDFDLTGSGVPTALDLDTDGGDATLPAQQSFSLNASQLGAHAVKENVPAGWGLTNLQCTGAGGDSSTNLATQTATLEIDAGENVVCTFTNTKGSSLTVIKVTDPASDPQDFDFDLTGAAVPADLDLDTDGGDATLPSQQTFPVSAGQLGAYTVAESTVAGWDLTALSCTGGGADSSTSLANRTATLDIDAGETVICTFTNTKHASLTVVKVTDPASDPQDFDFDLTGSGVPADLDLDTDPASAGTPFQASFDLDASEHGPHTVTETALDGWDLTALECTGGGGDSSTNLGDRKATLDVDAGETVVCTFTNTKRAKVEIVKATVPAEFDEDFAFSTAGSPHPGDIGSFKLNAATNPSSGVKLVRAGDYTVSEAVPAGWDLTSVVCTGDEDSSGDSGAAVLALEPGDSVKCVFTNTKRSQAIVVKTEGGNAPEAGHVWTFRLTGGPDDIERVEQTDGDGGSEGVLFDDLKPGTYTLCEIDMPDGWHSSLEQEEGAVILPNGDVCVEITIDANESQQVAVDNTRPDIEIDKTVRLLPDGSFAKTALAHVGDTVEYRFVVTNPGVGALTVQFSDPRCDAVTLTDPTGDADADGQLDESETWVYLCRHLIAAQDPDPVPNTATVTGTDSHGNSDTDTSSASVDILHPDIHVDKQVRRSGQTEYSGQGDDVPSGVFAYVGDTLEYRFLVTDGNSDTPIKDVKFSDPRCDSGTVQGPTGDDGD